LKGSQRHLRISQGNPTWVVAQETSLKSRSAVLKSARGSVSRISQSLHISSYMMYDAYYSRLIATEKFFHPRDGNEVIKIHDLGVRQG
jgi:hypothetical protein